MPYSDSRCDMVFLKVLASMRVERMLDLGCGMGKYGRMVKDWCPGSERTGVDIVGEYLTRFALHEVYQRFVASDICAFVESEPDSFWDLVVLGDVIEHLPKSKGIDLIHRLSYMASNIIVVYPDGYRQGALEGQESERHISRWSPSDFAFVMDYFHHADQFMNLIHMRPDFVN